MEAGDRETHFLVEFEPAIWSEEHDVWSLERICGWQEDSAVVYPILELRVLWTTQREMPIEDVGLVRLGVDAVGAGGQLLGFLQETLDGRGAG